MFQECANLVKNEPFSAAQIPEASHCELGVLRRSEVLQQVLETTAAQLAVGRSVLVVARMVNASDVARNQKVLALLIVAVAGDVDEDGHVLGFLADLVKEPNEPQVAVSVQVHERHHEVAQPLELVFEPRDAVVDVQLLNDVAELSEVQARESISQLDFGLSKLTHSPQIGHPFS